MLARITRKLFSGALLMAMPFLGLAQFNAYTDAFPTDCRCYTLTTATNNQVGTVWNQNAIDLSAPFDFTYQVFAGCNNDWGADGMAWALHDDPTTAGTGAGNMGMGGVSPSFGVFMDTFDNGPSSNDPVEDHITIHKDGDVDHLSVNNLAGPVLVADMEDCAYHTLRVTWNPGTQIFQVHWDGVQLLTYNGDIANDVFSGNTTVYWGFAAGTGGLNNEHRFCAPGSADFNMSDFVMCPGGTLSVSDNSNPFGGGILAQEWNFGDGSIDSTAAPSHTYSSSAITAVEYIMTDLTGCPDTMSIPLSVIDPSANVTATDSIICAGETVQLQVTGEIGFVYNYYWQPPLEVTDSTTASTSATPLDTTTFIATITPVGQPGCASTDSIRVLVEPAPTVELGNDTAFCAGGSVTLDATNTNALYAWSDGTFGPTTVADTTAQYIVSVTYPAPATCIVSDTINVVVDEHPVVNLGADTMFCDAGSLLLDAGNTGYNYFWQDNTTNQTLNASDSGTYWVQVISPNAFCTASDTIELTVVPSPTVELGADTMFCEGESILLDAGNPSDIHAWSTGSSDQTIVADTSGQYFVDVTSATLATCVVSDTVNVVVVAIPIVDLGEQALMCEDDTMQLDAENPGSYYLWNTGDTTQTIEIDSAGTYTVIITPIALASCAVTDTLVVMEVPIPTVDLGPDTLICAGDTLTLNAGNNGAIYSWSTNATSQVLNATTDGIYSVTVSSAALSNCSASAAIQIITVPVPVVDLGPNEIVCPGDSLILNAGNVNSFFLWNTGWTGRLQTADSTAWYSVTVTSPILAACKGEDSAFVQVQPTPPEAPDLGNDTAICPDVVLELSAGYGPYEVRWHDGSTYPEYSVQDSGLISYKLTDTLGCEFTDSVYIEYDCPVCITMPNVFTPNNDGYNDFFTSFTVNNTGIEVQRLDIFNRWGFKIYSTEDPQGWDGRNFSGREVPEGTYFWKLKVIPLDDSRGVRFSQGQITLMR